MTLRGFLWRYSFFATRRTLVSLTPFGPSRSVDALPVGLARVAARAPWRRTDESPHFGFLLHTCGVTRCAVLFLCGKLN